MGGRFFGSTLSRGLMHRVVRLSPGDEVVSVVVVRAPGVDGLRIRVGEPSLVLRSA